MNIYFESYVDIWLSSYFPGINLWNEWCNRSCSYNRAARVRNAITCWCWSMHTEYAVLVYNVKILVVWIEYIFMIQFVMWFFQVIKLLREAYDRVKTLLKKVCLPQLKLTFKYSLSTPPLKFTITISFNLNFNTTTHTYKIHILRMFAFHYCSWNDYIYPYW